MARESLVRSLNIGNAKLHHAYLFIGPLWYGFRKTSQMYLLPH